MDAVSKYIASKVVPTGIPRVGGSDPEVTVSLEEE